MTLLQDKLTECFMLYKNIVFYNQMSHFLLNFLYQICILKICNCTLCKSYKPHLVSALESYAARGSGFLTGINFTVLLLLNHLMWYFYSLMSAIQDVELFYSKFFCLVLKGCLGEVIYWLQMSQL